MFPAVVDGEVKIGTFPALSRWFRIVDSSICVGPRDEPIEKHPISTSASWTFERVALAAMSAAYVTRSSR
jgi:hypothetical protein